MATLYETTNQARAAIIVVLIVVVLILFIDIISSPAPELDTQNESSRFYMFSDTLFGVLPEPEIPALEIEGNPLYEIQGVHSENAFPDVSYVYQIEPPRGKLGVFENRESLIASVLGFTGEPNPDAEGTVFEWDKDNGTRSLSYSRVKETWSYSTLFFQNIDALATKSLSENIDNYNTRTQNFITRMDFANFGLDTPIIESTFVRLGINGDFESVTNVDDANYVFTNAFRTLDQADLKPASLRPDNVEGQIEPDDTVGKVYSEDPRKGQVSLIVSNQFRDYETDIFTFTHTEFEPIINEAGEISKSAYPLIDADEAWDNVTLGSGSLTALLPQGSNSLSEYSENVEVTRFVADPLRTELAFWQPSEYNEGYILPIYVFRGTASLSDGRIASFTIYSDAIKRVR